MVTQSHWWALVHTSYSSRKMGQMESIPTLVHGWWVECILLPVLSVLRVDITLCVCVCMQAPTPDPYRGKYRNPNTAGQQYADEVKKIIDSATEKGKKVWSCDLQETVICPMAVVMWPVRDCHMNDCCGYNHGVCVCGRWPLFCVSHSSDVLDRWSSQTDTSRPCSSKDTPSRPFALCPQFIFAVVDKSGESS